jgi:hypothetical protein
MLPFSVTVEGLTGEGQGKWVLAVDGDRVLLTHDDKTLHWYPMEKCRFLGTLPPDAPHPVVIVQPQQKPTSLVTPNRDMRRHPPNGA